MNKFKMLSRTAIFALFFASCSSSENGMGELRGIEYSLLGEKHILWIAGASYEQEDLLMADLHWFFHRRWDLVDRKLKKRNLPGLRNILSTHLKIFNFSPENCTPWQVACSYPSKKGEIFVTPNFFKMDRIDRLSTLIHEAFHHQSKRYKHVSCTNKSLPGLDCDETLVSPYGIEYLFLRASKKFLLRAEEQKVIEEKIKMGKMRINRVK